MSQTEPSVQVGMSLSLEDLAKNTKALRETLQDLERILGFLERSVIVRVVNATTRTIWRADHRHEHGAFKGVSPSESILPMNFDQYGTGTTGLLTGTEGFVTYAVDDDGTTFTVSWSNPFVGTNGSNLTIQGPNAAWYTSSHIIPGGNTNVRARYVFGERSLVGTTESDWQTCGECKGLHYRLDGGPCPGRWHVDVLPIEQADGTYRSPQGRHLPHVGAGKKFKLLYNTPGPDLEGGWRKCRTCKQVFFDGWDNKGICPVLSWVGPPVGHVAEDPGREYFLRFDFPAGPKSQDNWRFCEKCFVLFYEPHNHDGDCAAGQQHRAHPYNYVIDEQPNQ